MPSIILGYPLASGGMQIISGNPYSGTVRPIGGIQFSLAASASGNAYIGFSGQLTIQSGGLFASGASNSDGFPLAPGGGLFVPRCKFGASGQYAIFAQCDAAASGQARLSWVDF